MQNNRIFRIEEQFNYKGLNCYVGFHRTGHRIAGIEIPFNKTSITTLEQLKNILNCDYIYQDDEKEYYVIENDFGHIHNTYDIKGYKEIWGDDADKGVLEMMERSINRESHFKLVEGSKENAEESCKNLVEQCYAKNIINN